MVTRLSGGLTPADGADPRTFPAIWNSAIDELEVGYRYVDSVYFTSNGTFTKADYPWLRAVRLKMVGGGGGGGGAAATGATTTCAASGGGAGVYGEVFITDIAALSSSITVTVGAGGGGGAAGANDGAAGGTTSFGASISVDGGPYGIGITAGTSPRIRTANSASTGNTGVDFSIPGNAGGPGWAIDGLFIPGVGGENVFSARSNVTLGGASSSRDGPAGRDYGGGGSGAGNGFSRSGASGGNGADGIVVVELFA